LKTTLGQISTIQTGLFAKPSAEGDIIYLQAKHFDENGQLTSMLHPDLKKENISERHLLKHGDVLFSAKGTKNFAAWYGIKNRPAVASTSFFVIRLLEDYQKIILPEFLCWFINHPRSQELLKGKAIGSSIPSISKVVLEEMEITIPDLRTQETILKIFNLGIKEKQLKQQIETLKEKQIQKLLINAIK